MGNIQENLLFERKEEVSHRGVYRGMCFRLMGLRMLIGSSSKLDPSLLWVIMIM